MAQIDTPIGSQNYTYDFKVDGDKLTGKAISQHGESALQDGKVSGDEISFVEMQNYEDQPLRVTYKGKVAGDEIKFTRSVGDFVDRGTGRQADQVTARYMNHRSRGGPPRRTRA